MKTEKNILIAFVLNIAFSIFELFGGLFTNSISILSDSIHDLGDAISIGISCFMEKKSKKCADNKYNIEYYIDNSQFNLKDNYRLDYFLAKRI